MAIKSLGDVVKSNREEMARIFNELKKSNSKLIDGKGRFNISRRTDNNPYILIDTDGDEDSPRDFAVMSVGLSDDGKTFIFYLTNSLYYLNTDCLALTENNVYETMWDIVCEEEGKIANSFRS